MSVAYLNDCCLKDVDENVPSIAITKGKTNVLSVRTVTYSTLLFTLQFMTLVIRTWAINQSGKNMLSCELRKRG